jgi:hypothetical protein
MNGWFALVPLLLALSGPVPLAWGQDTTDTGNDKVRRITINVGDEDGDRPSGFVIDFDSDRSRSADYVRFGEDIRIERDDHVVGDVVSIGGNVIIEGKVSGDCVSVGGNIRLEEGAAVTGDCVSVGGNLTLADSTRVGRDAVSVWGQLRVAPTARVFGDQTEVSGLGFDIPSGTWGFQEEHSFIHKVWRFLRRVIWLFVLAALGALAFHLFPTRMKYLADTVESRGLMAFLAGLAGWILWLPLFILLCVTIVGIPVAILLIFLTPVLVLLGYVAAGFVVGERGLRIFGDGGLYKRMFTGLLFLEGALLLGRLLGVLGFFFDVLGLTLAMIGYCIIFIAITVGFGAIIITRFRPEPPAPVPASRPTGYQPPPARPEPPQAPPPPAPGPSS